MRETAFEAVAYAVRPQGRVQLSYVRSGGFEPAAYPGHDRVLSPLSYDLRVSTGTRTRSLSRAGSYPGDCSAIEL